MSRERTQEEVRAAFIGHLRRLIYYWTEEVKVTNPKELLKSFAFSVCCAIDGSADGLPGFILAPHAHPGDKQFHIANGEDYWPDNADAVVQCNISGMLQDEWYADERAKNTKIREQLEPQKKDICERVAHQVGTTWAALEKLGWTAGIEGTDNFEGKDVWRVVLYGNGGMKLTSERLELDESRRRGPRGPHVKRLDALIMVEDEGMPDGFKVEVLSLEQKVKLERDASHEVDNYSVFATKSGKGRWVMVKE
jgi:hypothetical protein